MSSNKQPNWDFRRGIATARVLTQLGYEKGLTFDLMLRHTGITRTMLDTPDAEIETSQELQLIRNIVTELKFAPELGFQAGMRYHVTTYGLWGYAVMSSATLGDAIAMASRMMNQAFALVRHYVERRGDLIYSTYQADHLPPDVRQFVLDRDRVAMASIQREVLTHRLPYREIHMRCAEPSPEVVAVYTDLFGVRPLFNQARDCHILDASSLHEPLPQANAHTLLVCEQMCRQLMENRQTRTGVAATVRDRLLRSPGRIPDMEEVAAEMRMTSRTLRRHLTAEGATFRGLLEEVRRTLTEELMAKASLTQSEIAERLGYADVTTFIEAFRRWKGVAPGEYRKSLGLNAPVTRMARNRLGLRSSSSR